jgi:ABC-type transport system involved in multi-copper enzyme maturation permease subunit
VAELLLVNTRTLLRFHARNRLLLGFALLMVAIFALSAAPSLFYMTATSRFEMLRSLTSQMNGFAYVFVPAIGLLAVSSHLGSRSIKLVVTKPCPPENWLAAVFLSAALVAFAIHALLAAVTAALSLWWGVPYQSGFLFVAVEGFLGSLVLMSFLTALAMAVHPAIAVFAVLFFNEATLYQLKMLIAGASGSGTGPWLLVAQVVCDAVYQVLPLFDPLSEKAAGLRESMRVSGGDWLLLGLAALYTALATAFFFSSAAWLLRRKSLA